MKVILNKDVKNLGVKDDVVNVSDGYARNYLLPKGLAKEATVGNLREVENIRQREERQKAKELKAAEKAGQKIANKTMKVVTKVGDSGKLFGSITSKEIAELLEKNFNITVDRRKIEIKEPIKALGTYTITVRLHPQVTAKVIVEVVAE